MCAKRRRGEDPLSSGAWAFEHGIACDGGLQRASLFHHILSLAGRQEPNTFMHPTGKGSITMDIGKQARALARSALATALAATLALTMLPSEAIADTSGFEGGGSL